jgi:protein tyrosine phosphatase
MKSKITSLQHKDRYKSHDNIFYCVDDHTRVCLSNLGDNGSDYINANYVDVSMTKLAKINI